jgi:hypothetical protein
LIDIAWRVARGDGHVVEELVRPRSGSELLALARAFAKLGKPADAVRLFRAVGDPPPDERDALLKELLSTKNFQEAYEVWSRGRPDRSLNGSAAVTNGGFEDRVTSSEVGFGWRAVPDSQATRVSIDQSQPHTGSNCLRLDWAGETNSASPLLSQLVLVQVRTRYNLTFAARTHDLKTGGAPVITIIDASSGDAHKLAESIPLPPETNGWQPYSVQFETKADTQAIQITLQRQSCPAPCPIFGQVWLDDFVLQKL